MSGELRNTIAGAMNRTGSISGPAAPPMFNRIGGPLTGMAVQSLMLGLPAYGLGRLMSHLADDDVVEARKRARRYGLIAMAPAIGLNAPAMWHSLTHGGGLNSDATKLGK